MTSDQLSDNMNTETDHSNSYKVEIQQELVEEDHRAGVPPSKMNTNYRKLVSFFFFPIPTTTSSY